VERSPNGSTSWAQIATTGTNVTTYSNTGLTASTAYYYRVRAANTGGDSGYSNTANATTQSGIVPPAAPGGLTATAASASQINLSWTDNANNETGFKVERSPNGSSSWAQIGTTGANVTTYSNTGLAAGTKYYYRVRATNSAGDSAYSNTANATTQLLSITLYPQYDNLIMIQSNDSSVQNTVYQNGELAVGVNWIYSSLTGIQDFLAGANLVKFDTSALAGRTIDSATLILETQYCGVGYYPRQWSLKAMYSSWSTSTITWSIFENTSYYTGSQINQSPPTYSGQMYNINLLTYVQNWANGTWSNYGICMTSNDYSFPYATSYDAFAFYSNEDTGGGRPRLVVTYH
jgi:hypothetical protein